VTEAAEQAVSTRERPEYSEETLEAKVALDRASAECQDARDRWISREIELRDFDQRHGKALAGDRVSDDPEVLGQWSRLTRLVGEAEIARQRAERALRDAGARYQELHARDEYVFRAESLRRMYAERDETEREQAEALRRRRSLLGRLGLVR
jgi:hypothetical protein